MHIHTYILNTHTHILYTRKVLPTVYYRCHLVIFSYQKSYQQYFDILLNYQKLEIYRYKRKK